MLAVDNCGIEGGRTNAISCGAYGGIFCQCNLSDHADTGRNEFVDRASQRERSWFRPYGPAIIPNTRTQVGLGGADLRLCAGQSRPNLRDIRLRDIAEAMS